MRHPIRFAATLGLLPLLVLLSACGDSGPGPAGGRQPQTSRLSRSQGGTGLSDQDADRFKGKAAPDIVALLGQPNFRRREQPAEVWQYYGQGCVLDLFLYDEQGGQRVTHAELRSRDFNDDPDPDCLPQLLQGKRQPTS